jgi:hypothetical protein
MLRASPLWRRDDNPGATCPDYTTRYTYLPPTYVGDFCNKIETLSFASGIIPIVVARM